MLEETGVTVGAMTYIRSIRFTMDSGTSIVDTAFLCKYESGNAHPSDPEEVASVEWMSSEEILVHPQTQTWTESVVRAAEELRVEIGW